MRKDGEKLKVVVGEDNLAAMVCPVCDFLVIEDVSPHFSNAKNSVQAQFRCKCGHTYSVFLERRKYYRKSTKLSGVFNPSRMDRGMTVLDLSRSGLKFTTNRSHDIGVGDELYVEFELDDRERSKVLRKIEVKSVEGEVIGGAFIRSEKPTTITNYLYFEKDDPAERPVSGRKASLMDRPETSDSKESEESEQEIDGDTSQDSSAG